MLIIEEYLQLKKPIDLLKWMIKNKITYGWMDKKYKKHTDFNNFDKDYRLLLPKEVYKYKIGVCWDQTIFVDYMFDKLFLYLEHKMIFIQHHKSNTHTFVIYKDHGKWWHFEHSWKTYRGIIGPFNTYMDIVKNTYKLLEKVQKVGKGYTFKIMNPHEYKTKLTCEQFLNTSGYNWREMEPPKQ